MSVSHPEDNSIHWERLQKPKTSNTKAPSAEVEMTAYVLLAYVTARSALASEDLAAATLIVQWIKKQQNAQGGFSSTQVCDLSELFTSSSSTILLEQGRNTQKKEKGECNN